MPPSPSSQPRMEQSTSGSSRAKLAAALTHAAVSTLPPLPDNATTEDRLKVALQAALAARDAAMLELSDVLEHNAQLLRALREQGASMEAAVYFDNAAGGGGGPAAPAAAAAPTTYAADLLARRKAIAAASTLSPRAPAGPSAASTLSAAASAAAAAATAAAATTAATGSAEEEVQHLQAAITLSLERLRELRWRELVLQADISDFTGISPNSRSLYESLGRLVISLPEGHPMAVKCEALAGVVEEMGATRGELSIASARLAHLRGRAHKGRGVVAGAGAAPGSSGSGSARAATVPPHTLWSALTELSTATPSQQHRRGGAAGGAAAAASASARRASRSPSPLPDSPSALVLSALHPAAASPPLPGGGRFNSEPTGRIDPPRKQSPRPFSPLPSVEMANSRGRSLLRVYAGSPRKSSSSSSSSGSSSMEGAGRVAGGGDSSRSQGLGSSSVEEPVRAKAEAQWAAFVRQFEGGGGGTARDSAISITSS